MRPGSLPTRFVTVALQSVGLLPVCALGMFASRHGTSTCEIGSLGRHVRGWTRNGRHRQTPSGLRIRRSGPQRGPCFDGCDLDDVLFHQCDLSRASFRGARLTGTSIVDCSIENADFTDAVVNGLQPLRIWPDTHLSEEQLMSTRSYKIKDLGNCVVSGSGTDCRPSVQIQLSERKPEWCEACEWGLQ